VIDVGTLLPATGILAAAVPIALTVDHWWGEPPVRWHPVVWMGNALERMGRWAAPGVTDDAIAAAGPFMRGALAWCCLAAVVSAVALLVQTWLMQWPAWVQALLLGLCLKPLLAWRMLRSEVAAVDAALEKSLQAGRERLSWLCSRDVSQLTESEVRETAIETLAENLNDSVVAPVFWFLVAGLPGAALYRMANTADAMWGYRGERQGRVWTWAGKWAARADDVFSWLPARLTAGLLWAAGLGAGASSAHWGRLPREAASTPSPNGGWPMATMALALGVRLGKPGVYVLNANGEKPISQDVERAIKLSGRAVTWFAALCVIATLTIWTGALT
jgi:adenosylcobinamide-phosphate synthase